jgi:dihydroorotase
MKYLIKNANIVNEGKIFNADLIIDNGIIECINTISDLCVDNCTVIDATGKYLLPGAIDDQVHFREPGLTHKGDIQEGSMAAVAGGTTSFMDMPNVIPQTTTIERLEDKYNIASEKSLANYSFYLGATNDNIEEIKKINPKTTCGLKVFMGSSTGNMLVDRDDKLEEIFAQCPTLIATHCEDTPTIDANTKIFVEKYGDDIPYECHPLIRSAEACYKSSSKAVALAKRLNTRLHILHLSTAKETELFSIEDRKEKRITGEVCVHHLWFNDEAYKEKGNFVRWNPAIKTEEDRVGLLKALKEGRLDVIATDHAPHTIKEKTGVYTKAAGGGPLVQHSLICMLELARKGEISIEQVVDKMCHAPADIFSIEKRGYIREGYHADLCLISEEAWTVNKKNLLYKCGWSSFEGTTFNYKVEKTFVNGELIYDNGIFHDSIKGQRLVFNR